MKIAIVHDWLELRAGAERVLEQFLLCWPTADLFVLCDFMSDSERAFLSGRRPCTSLIQHLPGARRHFRKYLPLMPLAIERLDLASYDVVLSSSHAVAKGVRTGAGQRHVSYIHTPMRYAWDLQHEYLRNGSAPISLLLRVLLAGLRRWDRQSSQRPDRLVANSTFVAQRIRKFWGRDSVVIHPPADIDRFSPRADKEDFYLIACRLVPYKRVDLAVQAFRSLPDQRLVIVGDGPERVALERASRGMTNVEFHRRVCEATLVDMMQRARAFLVPGVEDFGIATVEAQACATPVIAFGRGGSCDIVRPGPHPGGTGLFFEQQTAEHLAGAIRRFDSVRQHISSASCRANVERFSPALFRDAVKRLVLEDR
jgi:glycosyltransferase involved in cell wall biosynthesis